MSDYDFYMMVLSNCVYAVEHNQGKKEAWSAEQVLRLIKILEKNNVY